MNKSKDALFEMNKISRSYAGGIVCNLGINFDSPPSPSPPSLGLTLSACLCLCHPPREAAPLLFFVEAGYSF